MIFIVLGTQKFQMDRLLKEIDILIEANKIKEDVFAQIGNSNYTPKNYNYEKFLTPEYFEDIIKECRILITHSGVGTIMKGIKYDKKIIVYPRLEKYKEHVDNHQCEIAEAFANQNFVLYCKEEDSLEKLIEKCDIHQFSKYVSNKDKIINRIEDFIDNML